MLRELAFTLRELAFTLRELAFMLRELAFMLRELAFTLRELAFMLREFVSQAESRQICRTPLSKQPSCRGRLRRQRRWRKSLVWAVKGFYGLEEYALRHADFGVAREFLHAELGVPESPLEEAQNRTTRGSLYQ
jgi:hypothetical protein